ncbi:hypothetical protein T440DRAFT_121601 [Plenodomus tracheiphilus IPT5]|uniref:Uncharacterized protein n=1 Tax=Plenodomus tracheiphilus IPT5 TaxID=1408161 RepID=A0A6A7B6J6_9PLEO|nr:hypothetical protein T440DRAFT_121601 [Plenodomus tracheiphilus IPT5]
MARHKKFSFPLPRRSRPKASDSDNDDARSLPSSASVPDWPSRRNEPSSKALRILGTADTLYRSNPSQTRIPPSPGYMSIAVSEGSYGSHPDDRASATATDSSVYGKRPGMAKRSSSNLLGRSYTNEGARGSENSSVTQRLHPQASSSTLRSHYDAKSSPLAISQQTSDSAVRDRALRRGHPPVLSDPVYDGFQPSPASPNMIEGAERKDQRKSKPARLDLSKLFPKPKGGDAQSFGKPMLSPEKMVNSPAAMSMASDYFPRPMTREPTPKIGELAQLKAATRHRNQVPASPTSPRRKFDRDEYDNAKVNVRRPPKGVQHWFDALDEDSEEMSEDGGVPLHAPKALRPTGVPQVPMRKTSLDRMLRHAGLIQSGPRSKQGTLQSKHDSFAHEDIVDVGRLTSPSQYSVNTYNSVNSNKTKESALSKSNLQDASVLSFSSSEDEEVDQTKARRFSVRKSLDSVADAGEIIVGQAQAFDVRPHIRRPSAGVMSTRSTTSTSAATIEVMYAPEVPFIPYQYQGQYQNQHQNQYPRNSIHSGSKRSSHLRQPSIIHEDEDDRPRTAVIMPLSPSTHSIRSARTSASEPQARSNGSRKMMAVTAEEEALLELMRKKRAELQKNGSSPPATKSVPSTQRLRTPSESSRDPHRASAFRALEGSSSPALNPQPQKAPSTCSTFSPSPLLLPSRGRPTRSRGNAATSHFRDSSASATSDTYSDRQSSSPATRGRMSHYLPTPAEFSPLEPFPPSSPTPTASVTSPTDPEASHPPSPITPGLSRGEPDVVVKVASSDTSADSEEVAILDNGVIDAQPSDSVKSDSSHELSGSAGHQRRRTASSGADIAFPAPPTGLGRDLTPFSEASSRPSSLRNDQLFPKVPRKSSRRVDELVHSSPVAVKARLRESSAHSTASRNSSYSQSSVVQLAPVERRSGKLVSASRGSSVASSRTSKRESTRDSVKEKRNSVSDDVLAAWNSLGGTC